MNTKQVLEEVNNRESDNNLVLTTGNFSTGVTINGQNFEPPKPKVSLITKVRLLGIHLWNKTQEISVDDFFNKIDKSKKEIKIIDGMVNKYLKEIEKAEKMGQISLVEKMKDGIEIVKKEALAVVCGIKSYLTQSQIDKLLSKSDKNIEITFIKNFVRHIPNKLLKIKVKLDKEKVFDEYVVIHYDPKKENDELTKKEKEKKRDPILFGIIKDANNFYFIGDWKDEYCDLTLKEAISIIHEKEKFIS